MANTDNYTIPLPGTTGNPYVSQEFLQQLAQLSSGVLGNIVSALILGGVISGWEIQTDKTVSAGEGVVAGAMPKTLAAQAIAGLTNSALNYVYATSATGSATDSRAVTFQASLSPVVPAGGVRLGTITLDGGGVETALDNDPTAYHRDRLFTLRRQTVTRVETVTVTGGTEVVFLIDHSAEVTFTGMTEIRISGADPQVFCRTQAIDGGTFLLYVWNDLGDSYSYGYGGGDGYGGANDVQLTWERTGEI
jgi:hypothetical protein